MSNVCVRCGSLGKLRCGKCRSVNYCGVECQREHWQRGHKGQCKALSEGIPLATVMGNVETQPVVQVPRIDASQWLFDPARISVMADWSPGPDVFFFRGCGFQNLGNTCFINSVLQCLIYTSPLCTYLQSRDHSKRCLLRSEKKFCAMCEMEDITDEIMTSEYHLRPTEILRNLPSIGEFSFGHQDDANSFLYGLMQSMQQSLYAEAGRKPSPDEENTTMLHQLFGGHSKYSSMCLACSDKSERFDYNLTVTLNLSAGHSIEEALRSFFFVGDRIDDWKCSKCGERKGVERQSLLYQTHPILIVHLMRFDDRGVKINDPVAFRAELDVRPVLHPDVLASADSVYELYGVVVHYGRTLVSGHYVCFVRVQRQWFLCDDDKITPVPVNVVLQQSAYLLFYSRKKRSDRRALSSSAGKSTSGTDESASASKTSSSSAPVQLPAAAGSVGPPKQATFSVHSRERGNVVVDILMRVVPPYPLTSASDIRAAIVASAGVISVDCGGRGKVQEKVTFPLRVEGAVCRWYPDAGGCIILVLPVATTSETALGVTTLPVETVSGPVQECVKEEDSLLRSSDEPVVEAQPKAAPKSASGWFSAGPSSSAPDWHQESSYRALYEAIERARKVAHAPTAASHGAAADGKKEEAKRNDPCPCGSKKKYKQCHGAGK